MALQKVVLHRAVSQQNAYHLTRPDAVARAERVRNVSISAKVGNFFTNTERRLDIGVAAFVTYRRAINPPSVQSEKKLLLITYCLQVLFRTCVYQKKKEEKKQVKQIETLTWEK
ncbi:hypothetical protein TNCT_570991 [Trichonephila clavata]|uniref:Uncharacterized protein n=1 Tax=Trichonephila clavata TaxID=2740835 RepID=A0A8X6F928_TRICU|nr:hypothetical protein TNCT_570991 [Trichonephila clavata]